MSGISTSLEHSSTILIDYTALKRNTRVLNPDLIAPAKEEVINEMVVDKTSEPIKSMDDIIAISRYLITHGRFRDNMLFIVGINFGLRISDLRMLRFSDLINENFVFKDTFPVFEIKTRNTRKKKKNRYITINNAVVDAVTLYLENTPNVSLSDYLFRSESNNGMYLNEPITPRSVNRILKGIAKDLHLGIKMSTHTLRKTFCYHQMVMSGNSSRKLLLLQKMMNHSSPAQTLDYIGITMEEITEAYLKLNLGSVSENYLIDSAIGEDETTTVA
ncbi:tyrosine-type recombinase/integrase [Leyella stercorea]|uniref:tyrosine-type recombinase/integrase n=1 Tax=Leyella stercorea TaxID=363265 RepID=UPI00242BA975|nr:tyrosine-type recombinase/integrase [Leyella stercorea]